MGASAQLTNKPMNNNLSDSRYLTMEQIQTLLSGSSHFRYFLFLEGT